MKGNDEFTVSQIGKAGVDPPQRHELDIDDELVERSQDRSGKLWSSGILRRPRGTSGGELALELHRLGETRDVLVRIEPAHVLQGETAVG